MKSKGSGTLVYVCLSERKGTPKGPVDHGFLKEQWGLEGDAHAGPGHRQISVLCQEYIDEARKRLPSLFPGAFGENLIVQGVDLTDMIPGDRLTVGDAVLELTQIGKICHDHCAIHDALGECIMPRLGLFFAVLRGGSVAPGTIVTRRNHNETQNAPIQ